MNRRRRLWGAGAIATLSLLACGLSGCAIPGTTTDASTPPALHAAPAANTTSGTWVFKNATTNEVLRLHQDKHGTVSGDGDAAVRNGKKTDHSSIDIHNGRVRNGKLTLSLYVTQLDWGSGVTVVENLRCGTTARVLHCRMDLPLYVNVRNVPQDFIRRA